MDLVTSMPWKAPGTRMCTQTAAASVQCWDHIEISLILGQRDFLLFDSHWVSTGHEMDRIEETLGIFPAHTASSLAIKPNYFLEDIF